MIRNLSAENFLRSLCCVEIFKRALGCEPVTAKRGASADRATLDYLRGFYLARLRLVKTRRQKDVSTCTAAMSRWACATLDYPRRLNRDATRPMKASGLKDVRAYGKAGSLAVNP